jgi:hypothetical protein
MESDLGLISGALISICCWLSPCVIVVGGILVVVTAVLLFRSRRDPSSTYIQVGEDDGDDYYDEYTSGSTMMDDWEWEEYKEQQEKWDKEREERKDEDPWWNPFPWKW